MATFTSIFTLILALIKAPFIWFYRLNVALFRWTADGLPKNEKEQEDERRMLEELGTSQFLTPEQKEKHRTHIAAKGCIEGMCFTLRLMVNAVLVYIQTRIIIAALIWVAFAICEKCDKFTDLTLKSFM